MLLFFVDEYWCYVIIGSSMDLFLYLMGLMNYYSSIDYCYYLKLILIHYFDIYDDSVEDLMSES